MSASEPYRLIVSPRAERDLRKLPADAVQRLKPRIFALALDPRPPRVRRVSGDRGYRIRVGDYRVIYDVFDSDRLVNVLQVLRRTETTYRRIR